MAQTEEREVKNGQATPLDCIESCDTAALCRVLAQEDPLIISLLLGSLSLHKAAAVLQELPERLWLPVIEDLAEGNWESADTVECLAADIQNKIEQHTQVPYTELGGIHFVERFIGMRGSPFETNVSLLERNMWELARALKTASPALQAKIEGNMSARAVAMLREEIECMRPIRIWEIRAAQQMIVGLFRYLLHYGEVVLP